MQSIVTKYLSATNFKPSRIKATASNGDSVTVSLGYNFSDEREHWPAAQRLASKLGWTGQMVAGSIDGGYCFVFVDSGLTFDIVTNTCISSKGN